MERDRQVEFLSKKINKHNRPWRPVLIYVIFGFLWIHFSDRILGVLVQDQALYQQIQTYKGWFYVLITGALMYFLIHMDNRQIFSMSRQIQEKNEELLAYAEETEAMDQALREQVEKLDRMTCTDDLTGLRNRRVFEEDVQRYIEEGKHFAVYYLDVDHFKNLNDIHGHYFGDLFLSQFSKMLNDKFEVLQLYRWGGDEFVIIDPVNKGEDMKGVVELILAMTHRTWNLEGIEFHTSTSMGVVQCPEHGNDVITIFKNLEIALYRAKENGRSRSEFFNQDFRDLIEKKSNVERAINEAFENKGFQLNFQPIYDLKTRDLYRLEVLLRFTRAAEYNTNIGEVISVAEQTGQIHRIDDYVIESIFSKINGYSQRIPNLKIAVNISAQTFNSESFVPLLRRLMETYDIDTDMIEFEITEHTVVKNIDTAYDTMRRIKSLGFKIALDDFGTRYSSLNYLSRLPLDVLKVDKSYVDNILNKKNDLAIVQHIVSLAKAIGLETVAEGIEMVEQEDLLKEIGCDFGQGYHYARPQPIEMILDRYGIIEIDTK